MCPLALWAPVLARLWPGGARGYIRTFDRTEGHSVFLGGIIDFTLRLPWLTVQAL